MTELVARLTVAGLGGLGFIAVNMPKNFLKKQIPLRLALYGFGIVLIINGMTITSVLADISGTGG